MMALDTNPLKSLQADRSTVSESKPMTAATPLPYDPKTNCPSDEGWREPMIRRAAYLRSLSHPGCPGKELEDWFAAEREVDDLIASGAAPYQC
jgi:Protein of unknown function (DUF2934)